MKERVPRGAGGSSPCPCIWVFGPSEKYALIYYRSLRLSVCQNFQFKIFTYASSYKIVTSSSRFTWVCVSVCMCVGEVKTRRKRI